MVLLSLISCRNDNEKPISSPPVKVDTEKPTIPTNLSATNISRSSFVLNWTASTDNVGVTQYVISVNDQTFTTSQNTITIQNLYSATKYNVNLISKDAAGNSSEVSETIKVTTLGGIIDMYIGARSKYFKNGVSTNLQATADYQIFAGNIFVSNHNVYSTGYISKNINNTYYRTASYWKNGVLQTLEPTSAIDKSRGEDIAVYGNDVYVVGSVIRYSPFNYYKCYWKNGIKVILQDSEYNGSYSDPTISRIKIYEGDVYIVGELYQNTYRPVYWKNGTKNLLPMPTTFNFSSISCIDMEDNNLYVGGSGNKFFTNKRVAFYWKNNDIHEIIGCEILECMDVVGSDVYVAGFNSEYKPAYWKNGEMTEIPFGNSIESIKVIGNDVYILASYTTDYIQIQKIFKNGQEIASYDHENLSSLFFTQY